MNFNIIYREIFILACWIFFPVGLLVLIIIHTFKAFNSTHKLTNNDKPEMLLENNNCKMPTVTKLLHYRSKIRCVNLPMKNINKNVAYLEQRPQHDAYNNCLFRLQQLVEHYGETDVFNTIQDIYYTSHPELAWHLKNLISTYNIECVKDAMAMVEWSTNTKILEKYYKLKRTGE